MTATRRDRGFTLPELLIVVVLMSLLATAITMTIITSMRTVPDVTSRADTAVAVQGLTTWLPPDVDSAKPGSMDTDPGKASGCSGGDTGTNVVHLSWTEEFSGVTTTYVANYRFVVDGTTAQIVRYSCSGTFGLGPAELITMTGPLATTPPTVNLVDGDGDGKIDQLKMTIVTLSGKSVYIDAASKNPDETLPPTPSVATSSTTTTTTTLAVNLPPVASATSFTANPTGVGTFSLNATDPEGQTLTAAFGSVPAGWSVSASGLVVSLDPNGAAAGIYDLTYTVTDSGGQTSASAPLTVTITTSPTTTSTSTTTTTTSTSTTTTTLPPCVVSSITLSKNPVKLQKANPGKLKDDVTVTANVTGGYCIGLTLQYDTGAPNGQYVQNMGNSAPYQVDLLGHPHGTELWTSGSKVLSVRDSFNNLLRQVTLTVNP